LEKGKNTSKYKLIDGTYHCPDYFTNFISPIISVFLDNLAILAGNLRIKDYVDKAFDREDKQAIDFHINAKNMIRI
jgi:hypothetical protein